MSISFGRLSAPSTCSAAFGFTLLLQYVVRVHSYCCLWEPSFGNAHINADSVWLNVLSVQPISGMDIFVGHTKRTFPLLLVCIKQELGTLYWGIDLSAALNACFFNGFVSSHTTAPLLQLADRVHPSNLLLLLSSPVEYAEDTLLVSQSYLTMN